MFGKFQQALSVESSPTALLVKPAYRFIITYVPWWRPVRLAARHEHGFDFIGWVWRQKAYLVHNSHHGWIAFQEDQTPEKMNCCPVCGQGKPRHE